MKPRCSATRSPTGDGMRLIVSDHVRLRFPAYRAIVVDASGVRNGPSDGVSIGLLREAEARAGGRLGDGLPALSRRSPPGALRCRPSAASRAATRALRRRS